MTYLEGPDVSEWQGSHFPWQTIADQAYGYAIIRAGVCRSDGQVLRDAKYFGNINRARDLNIPVGSYWYMHSTRSGADQANKLLEILYEGASQLDQLGVWLDVEEPTVTTDMIQEFYHTFESGWPHRPLAWKSFWPTAACGIYTSRKFWHGIPGASMVDMNWMPLWVADWGKERQNTGPLMPDSWHTWAFWQYTSKASVDGYDGPVDMNRLNPSFVPGGEVPKQATPEESAYHCLQQAEHNLEEAARFMRQAREEAAT